MAAKYAEAKRSLHGVAINYSANCRDTAASCAARLSRYQHNQIYYAAAMLDASKPLRCFFTPAMRRYHRHSFIVDATLIILRPIR